MSIEKGPSIARAAKRVANLVLDNFVVDDMRKRPFDVALRFIFARFFTRNGITFAACTYTRRRPCRHISFRDTRLNRSVNLRALGQIVSRHRMAWFHSILSQY